jgi:arylformamidase
MAIFDLTHPIIEGMPVYPGDSAPSIKTAPDMPPPWRVSELRLSTHLGTHMDAPAHYFPNGKTIDQYLPERLIVPGRVVDARGLPDQGYVSWEALAETVARARAGSAIVIHTGWGQFWGTDRFWHYPSLSVEAAQKLATAGVSLIGMDTPSADPLVHTAPLIHDLLLSRDILLVENLARLDQLQAGEEYQFAFLPLLLAGLDGAPVRAMAWPRGELA